MGRALLLRWLCAALLLGSLAACTHGSSAAGHPSASASSAPGGSTAGSAGAPAAPGSGAPSAGGSPGSASASGSADQPGTPWRIPGRAAGGIEGYANHVSVLPGQRVTLYVSTPAPRFVVRVFRMGWYRGVLGRQVEVSKSFPGGRQSRPSLLAAATHTMTARWHPSATLSTSGWQPGEYLLRLESSRGRMGFVPLTVRAASARGKVVLVDAVTTWQAYNLWGCCDLYNGANGAFDTRSRAVTFDRPYLKEHGAGQFIRDELGVVAEAERLGLNLDYVTDVDLQTDPHILDGAAALVSMGHDEYWSRQMRAVVTAARDHGTNLAFFGANAVFRRIRYGSTSVGPDRLEINYKVAAEDPLDGRDNPQVTADWPSPPAADPESSLLGDQYGCYFGKIRNVAGVVAEPSSWMYAGTHVTLGEKLPGLIGPEIDAVQLAYPTPRPIEIVMHSPGPCPNGTPRAADASYYVARSGAGVFDAGSIAWSCNVAPSCGGVTNRPTHDVVRRVTDNILAAFAQQRAGRVHPAHDNVAAVGAR